jgi:hypothetical protein
LRGETREHSGARQDLAVLLGQIGGSRPSGSDSHRLYRVGHSQIGDSPHSGSVSYRLCRVGRFLRAGVSARYAPRPQSALTWPSQQSGTPHIAVSRHQCPNMYDSPRVSQTSRFMGDPESHAATSSRNLRSLVLSSCCGKRRWRHHRRAKLLLSRAEAAQPARREPRPPLRHLPQRELLSFCCGKPDGRR